MYTAGMPSFSNAIVTIHVAGDVPILFGIFSFFPVFLKDASIFRIEKILDIFAEQVFELNFQQISHLFVNIGKAKTAV